MTAIDTGTRTVGDVMTADPVIVGVDCPLHEAAEILDFYAISGLPVVDWSGFLAGVVSQTDIVRAEANEELSTRWSRLAVRDIMSRPAVTVGPGTSLDQAARLMTEQKIHRLVVVDPDDEPVGVVSSSDLVRALAERPEGDAASGANAELSLELS
jgi:CBS domain-containing protein